jgi:alkylresorcinol/alkylpyrone synthase
MSSHLHGLATALPPHALPQGRVKTAADEIFGTRYPGYARMSPAFDNAGIDCRYSVVPEDWLRRPQGWPERSAAFLAGAGELFVAAADRALDAAGWAAHEVDCVVTVCSTGIATPGLEAQVFGRMGFRADIRRVPVFGLGCAGGVSGLALAQALAEADPAARVLLVVVETCTLAFRFDRLRKADIIAAALFGDGAAAACLSCVPPRDEPRVTLGRGVQRTWPDTLDIMGWEVDGTGFGVVFDRAIPGFVTAEFADATDAALAQSGLRRDGIDRVVCHPGGAKVIAAIETALDLPGGRLDAERATLRRAGNMSAPTVLFVLEEVLAAGGRGQMLACALGPGFTASFLPLHVAEGAGA